MLPLTPEEQKFAEDYEANAARINARLQEVRSLPRYYNLPYEEEQAKREAAETAVREELEAHKALGRSRIATRIGLKNEINAYIASRLPGGEVGAVIEVANEFLGALTTDESTVGVARLLKTVAVMGIDAFNDEDIHAARARGVMARYTSLVATGLPEDFVRQLMIAEAGRALPGVSLPKVC